MKRIMATFGIGLACAIAMFSVCSAAENNAGHQSSAGSPIVVAAETQTKQPQAKQPTDADKRVLADKIQKSYKPQKVSKCGPTGQIAACSVACAAKCIFGCFPSFTNPKGPDSDACHSCVNPCMDKCTGCGS